MIACSADGESGNADRSSPKGDRFVLGLTGKSAAGKNAAADFFVGRGWVHFDTDRMAHAVLRRKAAEAAAVFGPAILTASGEVDRQRLGAIVFSDAEKMKTLESILYPEIEAEITRTVTSSPDGSRFLINGANLTGSPKLCRLCNAVLNVRAPFLLRLLRAMRRDRSSLRKILKRFRYQRFFSVQDFFPEADIYTVSNITTKACLGKKLDRLLKRDFEHGRLSKRK